MEILTAPPTDLLRGASLFLDFDGTLVEIAEHPDAVLVGERHAMLIRQLSDCLRGRVALISGRPAQQVRSMLPVEALTVVGSHGLEFSWADGRMEMADRPAGLTRVAAAMRELAAEHAGLLIEEKPLGVALHFRRAPAAEEACIDLAVALAPELGLQLQHGKMVVELRAAGGDKGSAIRTLMRAPDFSGTRPVFLGDDLTDEPAFLAARAMGGVGVLVGKERPTAAGYRVGTVTDAHDWLEAACEAIS